MKYQVGDIVMLVNEEGRFAGPVTIVRWHATHRGILYHTTYPGTHKRYSFYKSSLTPATKLELLLYKVNS